ncbi:hypothetical protein M0811_00499 [Anaeramoeba ignava]|uniref:Uncharacterized protein n=1 Tax=Anaeramoeba ignava TaxID=1746090 RepID=A0A9Q0LRH6_ANAIG|nr:hypothetical protein M0811_00499 [Anaeramoeba ignava]
MEIYDDLSKQDFVDSFISDPTLTSRVTRRKTKELRISKRNETTPSKPTISVEFQDYSMFWDMHSDNQSTDDDDEIPFSPIEIERK